jgi:two-component sensor histidine kinase
MAEHDTNADQVDALLTTPDLAGALESEQFRRFLDQVPIAIVVSEIRAEECIVYANPEFERVSGQLAAVLVGKPWDALSGRDDAKDLALGSAVTASSDYVGTFSIERDGADPACVDAYSNIIQSDDGVPCYRFVALVEVGAHLQEREEFEKRIRDKDILLQEIQHRVKNNLQMITALLRMEARNAQGRIDTAPFDRLAGRIEAIKLLYGLLSEHESGGTIDLGAYLGEVATAVLRSHAVEGIRLNLKVDVYPVSVDVAMPTGLVVNELLTNALKHAFAGRNGGTITLHSLSDGEGCQIVIADDGNGLPAGVEWPKRGKLGALIVQSLRENARAQLDVDSTPGQGTRVKITFKRSEVGTEKTTFPEKPGA